MRATVAATLLLLSSIVALLGASPAAAAGSSVSVATSGDHSERIDRLPISRPGKPHPRVAISIPVRRVGGVRRGDGLAVSAELQLTTDCDRPGPRCIGDPYHYNPSVTTSVVLAADPNATGGPGTIALARPRAEICRQSRPDREHHCVLVRAGRQRMIGRDVGCAPRRCWVNLVAEASSPRAHVGEFVAVGGLRPNGTIPQDRGRLNLVRTTPAGSPKHRVAVARRLLTRRLKPDRERHPILASRLGRLHRGDQLVVEAHADVDISQLPYNVVLSSQLIVTDRRGDVVRGRGATFVSSRGELDEGNGFNCTQSKRRCRIRKVGVLRVERTPRTESGKNMPLFVSLVSRAGPKRMPASEGDRVLARSGALRVTLFRGGGRGR